MTDSGPPELDPEFRPPSIEVLLSIPPDRRGRIITQLACWDDVYGSNLIQEYIKAKNRCPHVDPETNRQCTGQRWNDTGMVRFCLDHEDLDVLDPRGAVERKSRAAKLRLADMLEKGVDRLEELLDDDELAPALKLAALQTLFDRSGLPKMATQVVDARVEVTNNDSAAGVIRDRLNKLSVSQVETTLRGIEAASDSDDIIDADEVVDEEDQ
jgi:hypothetical protein